MAHQRADTGQGKVQWEESQPYGKSESRYRARKSSVGGVTAIWQVREQIQGKEKFSGRSHRPTANERARYRARECSVGGVTDLRPMREQDTGQGKVQWEESQTYSQ